MPLYHVSLVSPPAGPDLPPIIEGLHVEGADAEDAAKRVFEAVRILNPGIDFAVKADETYLCRCQPASLCICPPGCADSTCPSHGDRPCKPLPKTPPPTRIRKPG